MAYTDRTLNCVECGAEFTFSADDQEFHARKGYQEPKRCPNCRQARRSDRGGGGGGGYGGARQMYDAVCDNCGANTQVPFLPRQDRPVYCSDCFSKMKPARSSGGSW
ncbi:MAG TPA: CxxC-x17-CxxC domain-containing protein [Dehalococcoidia bacterium]|nr:CxxC-x17-CxxC domain-containing protein [Dehalococcoidia bacterium]